MTDPSSPTAHTERDLALATELYAACRDHDPGLAIATIAGALAGARLQGRDEAAAGHDAVYATAFAEGRESVGLGDFLPHPCSVDHEVPRGWEGTYGYKPLECTLPSDHEGQHEHETSGLRWSA